MPFPDALTHSILVTEKPQTMFAAFQILSFERSGIADQLHKKTPLPRSGRRLQMPRNKKRIGHSIAAVHSNDLAALQTQKGCASVQHFSPFPLFGRACWTSRYRMPPVLPSVGPEATLRTPDFRLPAIRPTFIFKPLRTNLSTPKIKKVANIRLQPNRPSGRLRRERDSNPRYGISVCRLSRAVQSTTLPSFHDVLGCELQRRGEGFSAGWAGTRNREAGIYQRTKGLSRVTE